MYYLDHNAATPMCERAVQAMNAAHREIYGNASSVHMIGANARARLEAARADVAAAIGAEPEELYFTSGGTEANVWALHGILDYRPGWALLYDSTAHKSIINTARFLGGFISAIPVEVNRDGVLVLPFSSGNDPVAAEGNCLVSVILANNEIGVIQPMREVVQEATWCFRESLIHVDAVQAFGKIPVDVKELDVDLMSISAHKIGGPKGLGALYVRKGVKIAPMFHGGHQEHDRRAGTENVAGAIGFQAAVIERFSNPLPEHPEVRQFIDRLHEGLDNIWENGAGADRLPNTVNVGFAGIDSDELVLMLSSRGVCVSNGSACEAGSEEGSHVLRAMGQSEEQIRSAIRFSFGPELDIMEIYEIAGIVVDCVNDLRSMGA